MFPSDVFVGVAVIAAQVPLSNCATCHFAEILLSNLRSPKDIRCELNTAKRKSNAYVQENISII